MTVTPLGDPLPTISPVKNPNKTVQTAGIVPNNPSGSKGIPKP